MPRLSIVVAEDTRERRDIEANDPLLSDQEDMGDILDDMFCEDLYCSCLPSCEGIVTIVSDCCDSLTKIFNDIVYGESDIEKDL